MSSSATAANGPTDPWRVLGLEPGADSESLKRAFRQQARRWHPDLNGNDPVAEERFKQVNEAYAVLSDPRRREAWERGGGMGVPEGAEDDPFATGFPSFETYLDSLFGRRHRHRDGPTAVGDDPGGRVAAAPPPPPPVQAAADQETLVELTPEQARSGTQLQLELAGGLLVEVATPPLAGDGWRLRLAGVVPGGGDHFLHLRVRTAEGLRIDGLRVLYTLDLSPADAALGCQALVPTLEGPVRLRVPPGSSSGRLLRLRGRGMGEGDGRGDQIVQVRIVVPAALGDDEQALYRRLRDLALEDDG